MTRIVCISDTHNYLESAAKRDFVPDGDILVHAGDLTKRGKFDEWSFELEAIARLPHKHKVIICGNHDFCLQTKPQMSAHILEQVNNRHGNSITYLEDSEAVVEGIKFYGSPRTPYFYNWAFNEQRGVDIRKWWDKIPEDTDILITHGPPWGILDRNLEGQLCGCEELEIAVKRIEPKYHIFGHIHEGYGFKKIGNTTYVNASSCNRDYKIVQKPLIIDIDTGNIST